MRLVPRNRTKTAIVAAAAAATACLVPAVATATGSQKPDNTAAARAAIVGGPARNVILLIGDGMGDSEITIARNYAKGAAGRLSLDSLPLTGEYTTYAVQKDAPTKPVYVTDSAASGTGWATGRKTYNGAISVTPDGKPVPTILELAKQAGYRTGDVSTAEVQDATPAVLVSHVVDRDCKGPEATTEACPTNAKENGGAGSISEQLVQTGPDIVLGGGAQYFDQTVTAGQFAGKTVLEQAKSAGYQVLTEARDVSKARMSVNRNGKVLGLFAPGNMDLEYAPLIPTPTGTPAKPCSVNTKRNADQPHLDDMAKAAIDLLDYQSGGQQQGFFLQVEGASIDKQDHAANLCGQIGETVAFDKAVQAALDYQRRKPDTLVVVTADHGHTSQIVYTGAPTTGVTASVLTADDTPMTVSYATAPYPSSQYHTGTEVRIAAKGPQAANVLGITDQTDLFTTMSRALQLG